MHHKANKYRPFKDEQGWWCRWEMVTRIYSHVHQAKEGAFDLRFYQIYHGSWYSRVHLARSWKRCKLPSLCYLRVDPYSPKNSQNVFTQHRRSLSFSFYSFSIWWLLTLGLWHEIISEYNTLAHTQAHLHRNHCTDELYVVPVEPRGSQNHHLVGQWLLYKNV